MRGLALLLLLTACAPAAPADDAEPAMNTPRPSPAGGGDAVENLLGDNAATPPARP